MKPKTAEAPKLLKKVKVRLDHPLSEFIRLGIVEDFPEKWCIKRTPDNADMVNKFFNDGLGRIWFFKSETDNGFLHYPNVFDGSGFYAGSHQSGDIQKGYTLITDEQFKNKFINNNMEDRKVLGYKAPVGFIGFGVGKGDVFTKMEGVQIYVSVLGLKLPAEIVETWEVVYAPEFKVGDHLFILNTGGKIRGAFQIGDVMQIDKILKKGEDGALYDLVAQFTDGSKMVLSDNDGDAYKKYYRLATPAEIEKASKIMIGGYEVKFTDKGITLNGDNWSNDELSMIELLLNKHKDLQGLQFGGCGKFVIATREDIEKINNRFK